MKFGLLTVRSWASLALLSLTAAATGTSVAEEVAPRIQWQSRYSEAMEQAKREEKMLFVHFHPAGKPQEDVFERWASQTTDFEQIRDEIVFCQIPVDLKATVDGETIRLIDHPAFAEMNGRPGVAMIDLVDAESDTYGDVVSIYPVTESRRLEPQVVNHLVNLPQGTLTQRTLTLAVCLHRERPKSVLGQWHPELAAETQSHSNHQARIRLQGHHNWGNRFNRIIGRLGGGLSAQEVCAESWPGQGLMDAAEECVSSWRSSSGHWGAVSARQSAFAYDMKRGSNGVWYATGIFAR